MKATIDIPDDLYRKVKARSAMEGRPIRDVTVELYRRWLAEDAVPARESPEEWLAKWLRLADRTLGKSRKGPTTRELLNQGRAGTGDRTA